MTVGTRAQVFHGTADKTADGLVMEDLMQSTDGRIKSVAASRAAKKRVNEEGKGAMVKVFEPAKGGKFKLQPKAGTAAYERLIKKSKKIKKM